MVSQLTSYRIEEPAVAIGSVINQLTDKETKKEP
jgi:hypothetical protein